MRKLVSLFLSLFFIFGQVPFAFAGEVVDQQQLSGGGTETVGDYENTEYRSAQSFKLSATLTVTAVEIKRSSNPGAGSPTGNWTLRIETDSSNPTGTLANANASIVVTPPAANGTVKGSFATPFELAGATTFWIVIQCDNQATTNYWLLDRVFPSGYADGTVSRSSNGVWAMANDIDLYFKVFVQTVDTVTPKIIMIE